MAEYFFKGFLSRFDAGGRFACTCGQTHSIATKEVVIGRGALESAGDLLARMYGRQAKVWVLSDENTERAAGSQWKSRLPGTVGGRILPRNPWPVPTTELIAELAAEVRSFGPDLITAVGSGVISDLGKKVSLDAGVPNWSVATAASVDAYPSATSAIRIGGYHSPVATGISEVIVCDLDVIAGAPRDLFLSGLGDLLAKFIAHLDWNLSSLMTGEARCPVVAELALGSARAALSAVDRYSTDPMEAMRTLTDAVLASGFAMQATRGSRPAASAEHTIAHFWETASCVGNRRYDLHGILVGAASRMVLLAYKRLYGILRDFTPDVQSRLDAYDREPPWQDRVEEGMKPYLSKIREEAAARMFDRQDLGSRLERFTRGRGVILSLASESLAELERAIEVLARFGYPFSLRELGVSVDDCMLAARNIRLLRSRYSSFDLAYELGVDDGMLAVIEERARGDWSG